MDMACGNTAWTCRMDWQYRHAAWICRMESKVEMQMDKQHGQEAWTCIMDMQHRDTDMQHGRRHAAWIWKRSRDIDDIFQISVAYCNTPSPH
jgi:hypothetical protein